MKSSSYAPAKPSTPTFREHLANFVLGHGGGSSSHPRTAAIHPSLEAVGGSPDENAFIVSLNSTSSFSSISDDDYESDDEDSVFGDPSGQEPPEPPRSSANTPATAYLPGNDACTESLNLVALGGTRVVSAAGGHMVMTIQALQAAGRKKPTFKRVSVEASDRPSKVVRTKDRLAM